MPLRVKTGAPGMMPTPAAVNAGAARYGRDYISMSSPLEGAASRLLAVYWCGHRAEIHLASRGRATCAAGRLRSYDACAGLRISSRQPTSGSVISRQMSMPAAWARSTIFSVGPS